MSNIAKLESKELEVSGKNYMSWMIDVKMHLLSMGIPNSIYENNECSAQEKVKAQVFICKHINEILRFDYLDITNPSILWNRLKEKFDHQKEVIRPNSRDEWRTLRFQYIKKVNEYNLSLVSCKFTKYYELNACLLDVEQNNEFLMNNHEFHPTRSVALPKGNDTNTDAHQNNTLGRGHGHDRG
ncbi:uncharacterized protein LOC111890579 [Lactuca sativa]|uniref:uncharacterized protein LOC111890579 n=1 Tax=Lactuca sativa TaxID=4236 RepID=UPI000CD89AA7|nr:uncharacterized protein LOC111890579 [Lactuca sativa]